MKIKKYMYMKCYSAMLLIILGVITLQCSSLIGVPIHSGMETWIGAKKNEFLLVWGPPTSVVSDGDSGEILTYYFIYTDNTSRITVLDYGKYQDIHHYRPNVRVYEANIFINTNKFIYSWRANYRYLDKAYLNPNRPFQKKNK